MIQLRSWRLWLGTLLILAPAAVAQDAVTFCAYNLRNWLSQTDSTNPAAQPREKPEREKRRIIEFLGQIRPDILGICEIGTSDDLADLQNRLRAAGINLPHHEFCRGADPQRSLALLSRHPITQRRSAGPLPYRINGETLRLQRGILDASVAVAPNFELRFIGVHLKSRREVSEADQELMRRSEAHLLRRHLDAIYATESQPRLVVYGDFNSYRNEPALQEVIGSRALDSHLLEIPVRDRHGLLWTHFWDAADLYSRLDYLFVSRALRPRVDTKRSHIFDDADFAVASDHRPLILVLQPPLR
jgi:endonuclease/exonuclease/phosphatase family metal-dependent hydrolase